jgi:sterol desaturase/sphingolipid hydroxylase (fatty acid hydroxylase superfamily)
VFEPSIDAFVSYFAGFCLRYFAIAGGMYLVFHIAFRERWRAYRIQTDFPSAANLPYEIRWSLLNTACTGLSTMLIYKLIRDGQASMYFDAGALGWPYFFLSIALCIVGYDTWIYWQHRWLHTPFLFKHVHAVHHRLANPTAFAAFAQHPVETFMGNVYFILFIAFVPIHPLALAAAGAYMFMHGVVAHSGYEFYPRGWTQHPLLRWFNTSTHHNMHHRHVGCNYGNWFNGWDTVMGTNHPAYHDTFEAVRARVAATATRPELERRAA